MKRKEAVNIIFATDSEYFNYTFVSILSLLEHKSYNSFYKIYIFHGQGEYSKEWEKVIELIQDYYNNCTIQLVEIFEECFKETHFSDFFSIATYYRLFVSEYLPDIEKCIYLDSDILVMDDLTEFYSIDINESYFGGVKDLALFLGKSTYENTLKRLNLPVDYVEYINAGIILINLKKIRDDHIIHKFRETIEIGDKNYLNNDQDIINKVCRQGIKLLPLKYNFPSMCIEMPPINILDDMSVDLKELEDQNVIIHFLGSIKPWQSIMIKGSELWWQYAEQMVKMTGSSPIKKKDYEFFLDWSGMVEHLKKQEVIFIWGYTEFTKSLIDCLKRNGIKKIEGIFDNDTNKLGKEYDGIKVIPYNKTNINNSFIIISSYNFFNTIKKQLLDIGVSEDNILQYRRWSRLDILTISEKYHKDLIKYIAEKEFGTVGKNISATRLWDMIQNSGKRRENLIYDYALDNWLIDKDTEKIRQKWMEV